MNRLLPKIAFIKLLLFIWVFLSPKVYSQPLTIAVQDNAAPWSQKDGTGFTNDIVKAAFKAVNQQISFDVVPYSRAKEMVISGKAVACFNMAITPEINKKVILSKKPLFTCSVDYFSNKNNKVKSEKEFKKGTILGIVIGYEYPPSIYELQKKGILILEKSESEETNLKKLSLGRIHFALITYNKTKPAELLLAKAGVSKKVKKAFSCGIQKSYIGFSKKHPQGKKASKKFNHGMDIIIKNGVFNKIEKKWLELANQKIKKLNL